MARKLFTNNAVTTLAASIGSGATALAATSGGGALFPAITGGSGNTFQMTIQHIVTGVVTAFEIVTVTARTVDAMTITRAQEGTSAQSWVAGDTIALFPTAAVLSSFSQAVDVQTQAGNFAVDTGSANAYVAAVTPALAAHVTGMPIVWKASNSNTGASTFSDGVAAVTMVTPDGAALVGGEIEAGGLYVASWDGAEFQLLNPSVLAIAEAFATAAASTAQSNAEAFTTSSINSLGTSTTANHTVVSSTTFVTVMTLTLATGIYKLRALLAMFQTSAGGTGGMNFQIIGGTATVNFTSLIGAVSGLVNGVAINSRTGSTIGYASLSTTSNTDYVNWDCDVDVTTAGTVVLQFAQNVAAAIVCTLLQGSSLIAVKIG